MAKTFAASTPVYGSSRRHNIQGQRSHPPHSQNWQTQAKYSAWRLLKLAANAFVGTVFIYSKILKIEMGCWKVILKSGHAVAVVQNFEDEGAVQIATSAVKKHGCTIKTNLASCRVAMEKAIRLRSEASVMVCVSHEGTFMAGHACQIRRKQPKSGDYISRSPAKQTFLRNGLEYVKCTCKLSK